MVGLFLMLKKSIKSEQEWRSYGLFWLFSAKKGWKINLLKKPIKRGRRARNANRKNGLAFYPTPWEPWKVPGPPQLWARWSNPLIIFFGYVESYAKIFLILYPSLENSTTRIAILQVVKNIPRRSKIPSFRQTVVRKYNRAKARCFWLNICVSRTKLSVFLYILDIKV